MKRPRDTFRLFIRTSVGKVNQHIAVVDWLGNVAKLWEYLWCVNIGLHGHYLTFALVNQQIRALIYSLPGMTQQGRDRKQRLVKKLWHEDTKTELHLSVYIGVLALLKEYVMVFQVY